ncbi:MAG: VWA domain-containing protein [Thermoflexales bacterium]|nr:VWA domain-containing protein [Thermoflexales bacterium]
MQYVSRFTFHVSRLAMAALALGLSLAWVTPAAADGIIIPYPPCFEEQPCLDCPPPRLPPRPWCPPVPEAQPVRLSIKYHRVTVTIDDQIALTHVDQVFVNDEAYEVEGIYIFPLPHDAAISRFDMWVDGQKIEGKVLSRDEARRIYDDIVRSQRDPALLEYVDRGAFQASIFPIPPGGERRIELEYSQILPAEGGLIHYVYPLNTEKFSARPIEQVSVDAHITSNDAMKAIYSPSHPVAVSRSGDFEAQVGYEAANVKPDQDFELYYSVSQDTIGLNVITYNEDGQDGYFVLLAAPKVEVDESQIVSKDVIAVIDTSGSMDGVKISQAKAALRYVLDHLNAEDRFNVVRFSTDVQSYAPDLRPAAEREAGKHFVDRMSAMGNTDINRALLEALASADQERPTILIFLTDGIPTTGVTKADGIIANVNQAIRPNVRLFAFGLGDDVNTYLLDTLSADNRGVTSYVRPGQAIDEAVSAFYAKVSTPVLADLEIDFGDWVVYDAYPAPLPDLFLGTQLVLVGRYQPQIQVGHPLVERITLKGTLNGQVQSFSYELPGAVPLDSTGAQRASFIPRLWATRKIGYLLTQIRLHGESKEMVQQIVELAVKYGIVTPYTSFLVTEEHALTESGRQKIVEEQLQALPSLMPGLGGADGGGVGAPAVEASVSQQRLYDAEQSPSYSAPGQDTSLAQQIRTVGAKTFVQQGQVWTDTAFDSSKMTAVQLGFGSDDYFKLVSARPELGRYFAQGSEVLVVLDGQAYQVVPGARQPLTIPPTRVPVPDIPEATAVSQAATPQPGQTLTPPPVQTPVPPSGDTPPGGLCGSAALAMAVLVAPAAAARRRSRRAQGSGKRSIIL